MEWYDISTNYSNYHWFLDFAWLWSSVAMVVTIDCRDTINCKLTIVLCNRGPWLLLCGRISGCCFVVLITITGSGTENISPSGGEIWSEKESICGTSLWIESTMGLKELPSILYKLFWMLCGQIQRVQTLLHRAHTVPQAAFCVGSDERITVFGIEDFWSGQQSWMTAGTQILFVSWCLWRKGKICEKIIDKS